MLPMSGRILLVKVRDGLSERKASVQMEVTDPSHQEAHQPGVKTDTMSEQRNQEFLRQQRSRNPLVTFYHNTISLEDVVWGADALKILVSEIKESSKGSLIGTWWKPISSHRWATNLRCLMSQCPKFSRWKETLKYGRIVPVPVNCEGFADPTFSGCGAIPKEFQKGYNHNAMGDFTRRWNRVLRHEFGRGGAPKCDELGWVDIESFLINDYSWPKDSPQVNYAFGRMDQNAINFRRKKLMEGYRHSMSPKARKQRMLVVAIFITPSELEEMRKYEDNSIYTEQLARQYRGWIRPVALRATSGHSFHGGAGKLPLMVNIDYKNLNMPFTKEMAAQLGGGYHVTSVKNLLSIVKNGLMPGGNAGNRDHVFFGEYAPWDPINTCTLTYVAGELDILVLYVPGARRGLPTSLSLVAMWLLALVGS